MKKFPHTLVKLKKISELGITKDSDFTNDEIKEVIRECNYLTYVFKETTRIDPAPPSTLQKVVYENFLLCGVKIPK